MCVSLSAKSRVQWPSIEPTRVVIDYRFAHSDDDYYNWIDNITWSSADAMTDERQAASRTVRARAADGVKKPPDVVGCGQ